MSDEVMKDFVLVGGTSLALQLGHRISLDLDLFSNIPFNETELADYLRCRYSFELDFISKNTVKGEVNGMQLDCIAHQYTWIDTHHLEENIRLASLADIAAMKLNAIAGNGTRIKDFIDIAFLSGKMTFGKMLDGYVSKYNSNPVIPLKAVTYFEDINFNEPIKMTGKTAFDWEKIEKRLKSMQQFPNRLFQALL